jgi:hypothetical protein
MTSYLELQIFFVLVLQQNIMPIVTQIILSIIHECDIWGIFLSNQTRTPYQNQLNQRRLSKISLRKHYVGWREEVMSHYKEERSPHIVTFPRKGYARMEKTDSCN